MLCKIVLIGMVICVNDLGHAHIQCRLHCGIQILHGLLSGNDLVDVFPEIGSTVGLVLIDNIPVLSGELEVRWIAEIGPPGGYPHIYRLILFGSVIGNHQVHVKVTGCPVQAVFCAAEQEEEAVRIRPHRIGLCMLAAVVIDEGPALHAPVSLEIARVGVEVVQEF